jgi:hypothetical protein
MKPLSEWSPEKFERHWRMPVAAQDRKVKRESVRNPGKGWVGSTGGKKVTK